MNVKKSDVSFPDKPATDVGQPISVDSTIDAIAEKALEVARRAEEEQKRRSQSGPIPPPKK
jgi:hypothetical protein